jgi:hypothetical protein
VPDQPARLRKHGLYKLSARSRITNGVALLPNIDNRSGWCRRFRDVLALHLSDIPDASHAEEALVRRASCLIVELERMESKFALDDGCNDPTLLTGYQRAANSLRRILESLGLQRRAKDITVSGVTLGELFKQDLAEQTAREREARKGAAE